MPANYVTDHAGCTGTPQACVFSVADGATEVVDVTFAPIWGDGSGYSSAYAYATPAIGQPVSGWVDLYGSASGVSPASIDVERDLGRDLAPSWADIFPSYHAVTRVAVVSGPFEDRRLRGLPLRDAATAAVRRPRAHP